MSISPARRSTFVDKKDIDNELQTFTVNGDAISFKCVPNRTSNFKLFCLVNQNKLGEQQAHEIWEYYREQFIIAKMRGVKLTPFRRALEEFVSEAKYTNRSGEKVRFRLDGNVELGEKRTRATTLENFIGLARYLELQYNVDCAITNIHTGEDVENFVNKTQHLLQSVVEPNDVNSYFLSELNVETVRADDEIYASRKLHVTSVYHWLHRDTHHYICNSELGPVKLTLPRNSRSLFRMFHRMITAGTDIVVTQARVQNNIDDTPFLRVERWFVE